MHVAIVEPFYTGSHKYWVDRLEQHLNCEVSVFSLPGRFWKWRMTMGAVDLAKQVNDSGIAIDLFLVTDMLDASLFKALLKEPYSHKPMVLYMHENQIVYPYQTPPEHQNWDRHYGIINVKSALVADQIWFNSKFHKNVFYEQLLPFLKAFPDTDVLLKEVAQLPQKSHVVPLGIDLSKLQTSIIQKSEKHTILWNHRWEFDKNPKDFFHALRNLSKHGLDFDLIVCGESFVKYPVVFDHAKIELEKHIIHWGYAETKEAYYDLIKQSTVLPVTSNQEFFGLSVMEAVACQVKPILPNRLSYPELYGMLDVSFYSTFIEFEDAIRHELNQPFKALNTDFLQHYDWPQVADLYVKKLASLVS